MQIKLGRRKAMKIALDMLHQLEPDNAGDVVIELPDNWTDAPPTKPGWYWNLGPNDEMSICLVETVKSSNHDQWRAGDLVIDTNDGLYSVRTWSDYWLGPLPEPTPPGVDHTSVMLADDDDPVVPSGAVPSVAGASGMIFDDDD